MLNRGDQLQQGGRRHHFAYVQPQAGQQATLIATVVFTDREGDLLQSTLLLSALHTPLPGGPFQRRYANRNPNDPAMTPLLLRTPDLNNNVQKIVWPNIPPGTVDLQVEARFVVPSAPGVPAFPGQDYAIVWQVTYHA